MQADDPPFLPVGTDVSAKYKGAFCEAKVKKVVRNIKCKVSLKTGGPAVNVTDEAIKGTLRVGNTVEVRLDSKKEMVEGIITKIQDCSQYTVVFDDGDITTLRRSALCLKSGRHFAESETLDQLPLTHPEHFGNPVIGSSGRRGRRTNRTQSDDSDSETTDTIRTCSVEREPHTGRVVLVQCGGPGGGGSGGGGGSDRKRPGQAGHGQGQSTWFTGLVVAPSAQDTVKIRVKEDYLVRSFKDGRYYTVPKKEAKEFKRGSTNTEMGGVEAAIQYLDKGVLPPHWDRDILFGQESHSQSDVDSDDSSDDEPREEKDHFVAQLYKFMDDRGTPLNRQPTIANKDIDLYRLFNVVQKLGGYNRVTNQNQWKGIAIRLGFQPATTSVTNLCKQAYKKFLHSFEEFYRKLGVTLVAHPRGGRSTGRSLIRDRDKVQNQASSPAHNAHEDKSSEPATKASASKGKDKEDKDTKDKDTKEADTKDKDVKPVVKETETKEKETKMKDSKVVIEKEIKKETVAKKEVKEKETKEKEIKDKEAIKEKTREAKVKKETKVIKQEIVNSSDGEDSGDNQPLVPLSNKIEKVEPPPQVVDKPIEKVKAVETPAKAAKLVKSSSGIIEGSAGKRGLDRGDKGSVKKVSHRRGSLQRTGAKDSPLTSKAETRCKSSSSDSSTTNKKPLLEVSEAKVSRDREASKKVLATASGASSDRNDSDSSSRGSKTSGGKTPASSRRNNNNTTPTDTPPSTPGSSVGSQQHSTKKPRKRKATESTEPSTNTISADVGDRLKVYYGPAQSESRLTYEAKVIEIDGSGPETLLRVHYTGWNTRYDEWIKPSRIADNLSEKNKHKDKGRRKAPNAGTGPPESPGGKKARGVNQPSTSTAPSQPHSSSSSSSAASHSSKPHTRNRSGSNNTTASNQPTTDVQSDSDSECESDSSGQRRLKKLTEECKPSKDVKAITEPVSSSPVDKVLESEKEKIIKMTRVSRSPQVKRTAENTHNRVKRTRIKQEDSDTPRGRDFDLNEIRSELKGLEKTVKTPVAAETVKVEPEVEVVKEDPPIVPKQEKTPEKVTEDIYEFKEPEPFEFEARKSEEKKKRPTHRIFDDLPQLKLSTSPSPSKSPVVEEDDKGPPKSHYDSVFDKLCKSENYIVEDSSNNSNSAEKEGEALSLFSELAGEDSGDRLLISEAEDSQEPLFTYQQELFTEKSFLPMFKGFTPAKNQETYSKKDASNKIRDVEDDFTNSPVLKGEQSSDEDPIDAAIQRVNAHPMSDDSNDGELLIKTPATPTPSSAIIFPTPTESKSPVIETKTAISDVKQASIDVVKSVSLEPNELKKDDEGVKNEEPIVELPPETLKSKQETQSTKTKQDIQCTKLVSKEPLVVELMKKEQTPLETKETPIVLSTTDDSDSQLDLKGESDSNVTFTDVIMPEPPAFLIHKEGPSIAEKVLRAISSAKRAATPTPKETVKVTKIETPKVSKITNPKTQISKISTTSLATSESVKVSTCANDPISSTTSTAVDTVALPENKLQSKIKDEPVKPKETIKETVANEPVPKPELVVSKVENLPILANKRESTERRKSGAESSSLCGKSNKVLSETIQKLSSQISQPTPAIPLPEYKDERSEESDSDDSDRRSYAKFYSHPAVHSRLIIDKLSEEESQSGISLSESSTSHQVKLQSDKSGTNWSATDSQQDMEIDKSCNTLETANAKETTTPKQPEEDSNISLLLCEETIPGSPAPENLGEGAKSSSKQRSRNLEIPFASAPSISPDQASKDPLSLKDMPRENCRDAREGINNGRNERRGEDRERERERERERDRECLAANNAVDTVMDNTPPITPDSSLDNMSPNREQQLSDGDNIADAKTNDDDNNRTSAANKKMNDMEKSSSGSNLRGSAPGSPLVGGVRRGRRPRSLRASESEDAHHHTSQAPHYASPSSTNQHRPLKYNFYVELDIHMDASGRIALLTSRLAELRKAYHSVKAELATIDRRRKKLRRKEREAVKAARTACS